MSKRHAALASAAVAAFAGALAVAASTTTGDFSSSHPGTSRVMLDPATDNAEPVVVVGGWLLINKPDSWAVEASWTRFESPAGGPYFGKLDPASIASAPGASKSFVGPADDPFFVDIGAIFDGINIDKPGRP